jgi:hypothetical protein
MWVPICDGAVTVSTTHPTALRPMPPSGAPSVWRNSRPGNAGTAESRTWARSNTRPLRTSDAARTTPSADNSLSAPASSPAP